MSVLQHVFDEASSSSSSSTTSAGGSSSGPGRVRYSAFIAACSPWDGGDMGASGVPFAPPLALGPADLVSALAAAGGGAAASESASRAQRLEAWVARDGPAEDSASDGECSAADLDAACGAACKKALHALAGGAFLVAS